MGRGRHGKGGLDAHNSSEFFAEKKNKNSTAAPAFGSTDRNELGIGDGLSLRAPATINQRRSLVHDGRR